jgi:dynein light intermediate chain 2
LVLGERRSGKSTILQTFLSHGKEEAPKATAALDYSYARAPLGVTAKREIGHIYELGGGRLL